MRISKFFIHPVLVLFIATAFLFFTTGCERAVTYYDKDGKPYTVKETDPWMTIGGILLTCIIIGAIAASADSSSGASGACLPNQGRVMLAHAGNKGIVYDVSSGMYNPVKCFKLMDAEGNVISEHLIDVDRLLANRSFVNVSDVQVSSKVDKTMLRKLAQEIAKANNLNSMPNSIKTDISFADNGRILKVNDVSIPVKDSQESRNSGLTVISERGVFRVSAGLNEKPDSQEAGQLSVTVSQLN
ncbi:MAG: hypothetical protein Q8L26_08615 [Candidatus Omnitrophota bacterium]|nr:hypothetical protein [Candidatus Omnitrophota bacterium]